MKPEMLAAAHWGYVESVLQLHGEQLDVIEKCGQLPRPKGRGLWLHSDTPSSSSCATIG